MANNTLSNPWVIDTASATPVTADTIRVRRVRWVGATTAGHTAIITDSAGHVVWTSVAPAANYDEESLVSQKPGWRGVIVPTLASGKLYLEFE